MSDIVLEDQGEPSGLSANQTAIYPDTTSGNLYKKKGSGTPVSIEFSASSVLTAVLTGVSFATSTAILATDTILEAFGKLQAQINNLSFNKTIFNDYIVGSTGSPTTTATSAATATVISEMTKAFTPDDASNKITLFFNGDFGENGSGKDETVHVGVFIDGTLEAETERSQTVKGDDDDDKIGNIPVQWQGSLSASPHTIDIRFWVEGAGSSVAVALGIRRNLIIKEVSE